MSVRLTYPQVEEFVDLYTTKGAAVCMEHFGMTPYEVAKEASTLNVQEPKEFTDREKDIVAKYGDHLGQAMIFLLTDRRPSEFKKGVSV